MARYLLSLKSYIDGTLYEPGQEVSYAGIPGPHMVPLDAEAKQAMKNYLASLGSVSSDQIEPATVPLQAEPA